MIELSDDGIWQPNGEDDYDVEAPVPNSWVDENGTRHITVWDENIETRYELRYGKVLVEEVQVF